MARIFACLAVAVILLFVATGVFGLSSGRISVERHVLLAVFTLVLSCLVQVIGFTYLTVTGKMMGQAVHLGRLDGEILHRVRALKRRLTYCLPLVILPLVVLTATGASRWSAGEENLVHFLAALASLAAHTGGLFVEGGVIVENERLWKQTLDHYTSARRPAGGSAGTADKAPSEQ